MTTTFHFLRPEWFWALLPAGALIYLLFRRQAQNRQWRGIISDHLLKHLLVSPDKKKRLKPWQLLAGLWVVCIIALAGPTWKREPSPFAEDTAALFIVMKVTQSMEATDIQPSRRERAIHKVRDLMTFRGDARTGLIAYAGSAHLVMPLTGDTNIITGFARELSPKVMPLEGDVTAQALAMAAARLKEAGQPGSILLLADTVAADQLEGIRQQYNEMKYPVQILGLGAVLPSSSGSAGTGGFDKSSLEQAARAGGGALVLVTPDDRDVRTLAGRIEQSLTATLQPGSGDRWQDAGYWLMPLIALLGLVWFRPGWIIQHE